MELADQQDFFKAVQDSRHVIVHFYRPSTWRCDIIDRHIGDMAPKYIECRFLKINAEKAPFLVEKLGVVVMPTILLVVDGKVKHEMKGFEDFGGIDTFPTDLMAYVFSKFEMIKYVVEEARCGGEAAAAITAPGCGPLLLLLLLLLRSELALTSPLRYDGPSPAELLGAPEPDKGVNGMTLNALRSGLTEIDDNDEEDYLGH